MHAYLTCNGILHVVSLLELRIDNLLVLDVDQRSKVRNGRSNQSQAPKRDEFDQEVGNQGRKESLWRISINSNKNSRSRTGNPSLTPMVVYTFSANRIR